MRDRIQNRIRNRIQNRRQGFTLIELLVVIAIVGILVAMLLPAVQRVRESSNRTECSNNLRQLGIALLSYQQSHRVFPASGWTKAGPGNPAGKFVGWRALTLPFIEQENLQHVYDFNLNWWEGANLSAGTAPVKVYLCPSVPQRTTVLSAVAKSPRPAMTFPAALAPNDYEAIMGVQPASINPHLPAPIYTATVRFSVMSRNSETRPRHITDGFSSTIMVLECSGRPLVFRNRVANPTLNNDQGIGWIDSEGPFSFDGAAADGATEGCGLTCSFAINRKNDNEPFSFHPGGASCLFADGHVSFLRESVALPTFAALCTMNAGEIVSDTYED